MDEQVFAHELKLFREALSLPTVGMSQVGDVEKLRSLIHQYPAEAKRYIDEVYGWKPGDPVASESVASREPEGRGAA